ncbi:SusC/RagA family TonB-linked outer membrane protein [Flavobacterium sp. WC2509]|uniref:SusC/RagA family TonB-linked outer membrane protein n=1 Tax=Flavobacterium sp. WC2509 TaxID=3461406 RepID=UPI004043F2CC
MRQQITNIFYSFTIAFVFLAALPALAQGKKTFLVRGQVVDSSDKLGIPGATIAEQDADNRTISGAISDIDGNFAIRVNDPNNKLFISTIGYKSQRIDLKGRESIKILLVSTIESLDAVVVNSSKKADNGLLKVDERNRTTSSVSINAADLAYTQAPSIDEALQGRLAGVDITADSGDPGAGMQIRIRGTSSISGSSDPLIVVDGMPYETVIPPDFNFGTADEQSYSALLNIAPSDIETITVLKDAAATAMWGSRAASGVLLITTKRGGVSAPKISYTYKATYAKPPATVPMLNGDQYSQLIPEEFMNKSGVPLNTLSVKEFQYDPQDVYYFKNYGQNTDWIDAITQTGKTGEHTLSLQGGGEKARYYSSVGYYNSKGVTKGTGLDRLSTRLNLDYVVSDRIKFRTDISYTHTNTQRNYVNSFSGDDKDLLRGVAYVKMPNMSIYEYDAQGNITPNYFTPASNIQGLYPGTYNPVAMVEFATNEQEVNRITPHFNVNFDIFPKELYASFDLQFDYSSTKNKSFLPQNATGRPFTETVVNRASDADIDGSSIITKTNFVYTPNIGKSQTLQALLSLQTNDSKSNSYEALTSNTASSLLTDPSVPSRTQNSELKLNSGSSQSRSVGAVASVNYGLLDRYLISAGLRVDGSSKFGPENRYGYFPSISGRWRVSGESFMKDVTVINDLSVRASYGQAGRAPRYDYRYFNTYKNFSTQYTDLNGVIPSNVELTNLRWETVTGTNLGFTLQMFKNRVSLDVDLYKNVTSDLFFENMAITSVSGYNSFDQNGGTMDNKGYEVNLTTTPFKSKDWKIDFNFNISSNQNTIKEISEYYQNQSGNTDRNGEYKSFLLIDNPFGSVYGYRFKGVYSDLEATKATDANGNKIVGPNGQEVLMRFNYPLTNYVFQPGDAKYEDVNHDGNIDSRDVVYLGNGNPKFTGGFGPNFAYKNQFFLLLYFTYRLGYDVINRADMMATNMYGYNNQSTAVLSRWRNPGDVTEMPRAVYQDGYNWLGSDRYVEDASFARLRSVTFRYAFAKNFINKLKLTDLSFYATADNLFTFTNYKGQDPEKSLSNGAFGMAIDNSSTPPTKRVTLGLSVRF